MYVRYIQELWLGTDESPFLNDYCQALYCWVVCISFHVEGVEWIIKATQSQLLTSLKNPRTHDRQLRLGVGIVEPEQCNGIWRGVMQYPPILWHSGDFLLGSPIPGKEHWENVDRMSKFGCPTFWSNHMQNGKAMFSWDHRSQDQISTVWEYCIARIRFQKGRQREVGFLRYVKK